MSNAADFVALTETNFEILTSEVFKHEPTYISGVRVDSWQKVTEAGGITAGR